jgi:hypothetical protein
MAKRKRIYLITVLFFCFVLIFCTGGYCQRQVVEFPGTAPGEAHGQIGDKGVTLADIKKQFSKWLYTAYDACAAI